MIERYPVHGLLRGEGERDHQVSSMELFFDLVYVFAITQLSHLLSEHLDVRGALQTALLLLALWWAWVDTAWLTNWFDPDRRPVRVMLIGTMVATLIVAVALPEAFRERGFMFAVAFVAMQVGRTAFAVVGTRQDPALHRNFQRILAWQAASGLLWLAGGLASESPRTIFWVAAVAMDSLGPAVGFATPGLGRSITRDWHISGEHMAERCKLFLIIALGESILVIGGTFGQIDITPATLAAFLVAFLGSVALWWVYFDVSFDAAEQAFASSSDPGQLGRFAYTYLHIPMVAGIIVTAVGDELVIARPFGHATPDTVATVLGGPALFLAGHLLFKRAVFGVWSIPRIAAIAALAVLALIGRDWSPLALAIVTVLVIAAVSWQDTRTIRSALSGSPVAGHEAAGHESLELLMQPSARRGDARVARAPDNDS
jgi:low temperature requirement protein LtrA